MLSAKVFFKRENNEYARLFAPDEAIWLVLTRLSDYIKEELVKKSGTDGATIMPGAYLHDEQIFIGRGSVVEPGAFIKGPTIIGENTEIRQGAYIRGNALIGNNCVVGHTTEVKNSIFLDGARAGHFAYVGDSILGKNVNLGAGTKLANLKMTDGTVKLKIGKQTIDTGRRKLGAIIGDNSETGCNSVTSPGTFLGPQSVVYPTITVAAGYYPEKSVIRSST